MKSYTAIVYTFLLVCVILSGCKHRDSAVVVEQLPESVKTDAVTLTAEPLELKEEFIYATRMNVYRDSILIVINKENSEVPLVQLYNINTGKIIGGLIFKGNGPGEMLGAMAVVNKNILNVFDHIKNQFVFIDINNVLSGHQEITINKIHQSALLTDYSRYDDSTIVILNPFYFKNKELNVDNNQSHRIYKISLQKLTEEGIAFDDYKYFTHNITQGTIITNNEKGRIFFASDNETFIEMYDENLNLIKKITGPDELDVNYMTRDLGGTPYVSFKGGSPNVYKSNFYACDDYFLLIYIGKMTTKGKGYKSLPAYIFKFDWDGNFQKSYFVDSSSTLETISVGSDGETMYGMAYDKDGLPIMVKLEKL